MATPRRICVVTGGRAEYGLLFWLMKEIQSDRELQLQVIATGMHLSPEFGNTYRQIESDGFAIDAKVDLLLSSDTPTGIAKSIGRGVIGFADAFERLKPEMIVVLGDRFEILAAAQAAMVLQIPMAHLAGGDTGAGTYDNIMRHCITKMASLHFVTHEQARKRVIQLGEDPERVFCFGATCVDNVARAPRKSREALQSELGVVFKETTFLATFHPLTMDSSSGLDQLQAMLRALDSFSRERECSVIFTKPNADAGGRAIARLLESHARQREDCYLFDSLGWGNYLNVMRHASVVIGNSSSGIYEAPYVRTPTVDIGARQRGRAAPASVIHCEADDKEIRAAISTALAVDFDGVAMIYGEGNTSSRIKEKLRELVALPDLAIKSFFDVKFG